MAQSDSQGYLAVPASVGGPGVLVLHPWWGLSRAVRDVCDRLARQGFVAYAPDLYHGRTASTIEAAEALANQLNPEGAMSDIHEAVNRLSGRAESREHVLGVVGLSLGAYYALRLSVADPGRIGAVVLFYGTGEREFSRAKASYTGHFAETDPYETAEAVDGLEAALKSAGRPVTFYRYSGVGHWFFEYDRPEAYDNAAAVLAWERTVDFLAKALS